MEQFLGSYCLHSTAAAPALPKIASALQRVEKLCVEKLCLAHGMESIGVAAITEGAVASHHVLHASSPRRLHQALLPCEKKTSVVAKRQGLRE